MSDDHSEPRAEWTEAEVEKAARELKRRGLVLHAMASETVRVALSASGAVSRAEAERVAWSIGEQWRKEVDALRVRCEGVAKELREESKEARTDDEWCHVSVRQLNVWADRLGGPDDAPKEPEPCATCGDKGWVKRGDARYACPSCGSLPEREAD